MWNGFRARRAWTVFVLVAVLVGCAHSAPEPVVRDRIEPGENVGRYTHLLITHRVPPGVHVPEHERDAVVRMVEGELQSRAPGRFTFVDAALARTPAIPAAAAAVEPPPTLHMDILFTRYDEGNAGARFMLAGLGQIHLGTTVTLRDRASDQTIGVYDVSKQFAFGGIYGAMTDVRDVEAGLAAGIADILVPGPGSSGSAAAPKGKAYP